MFQLILILISFACLVEKNESATTISTKTCSAYKYQSNGILTIVSQQTCKQVNEFCCGSCMYRFCCSVSVDYLNQKECKNNYNVYGYQTMSLFSLIFFPSSSILLMCFVCFCICKQKMHSRRQRRIAMQRNQQTSQQATMSCTYTRQSSLPDYWDIETNSENVDVERVIIKKTTNELTPVEVLPPPYPGRTDAVNN